MVMSWVWTIILAISVVCAMFLGNGQQLGAAVISGAQSGISLCISIAGSICLWTGVGKLMEHAGITRTLSLWMRPLLNWLFPSSKKDAILREKLSANISANILGLGNAATPMGIQAAQRLADSGRPGLATDELCRLIVLNTASIQLIPGNVAAVRASFGAQAPFDILPAVWVTSLCSTTLGLTAAWLMGKAWRDA
ncbi:MAG: spore maturation protein A [Oscillospiraceae bacterium]|nr:spore maturation protein A [Oscillospiraceae bacterium]